MDSTAARLIDMAYQEALKAFKENETPVGAVLVKDGTAIAAAHNLSLAKNDPTMHAEMLVLQEGFRLLNSKNLSSCEIFITLEPCLMCLGAIINSHIRKITFGALDPKKGAFSRYGVSMNLDGLDVHYAKDKPCGDLLTEFFRKIRL